MSDGQKQLYVLDTDDINRLGEMVKELKIGVGMSIWNYLLVIAQSKRIENVLDSWAPKGEETPTDMEEAPQELPKAPTAKKMKRIA